MVTSNSVVLSNLKLVTDDPIKVFFVFRFLALDFHPLGIVVCNAIVEPTQYQIYRDSAGDCHKEEDSKFTSWHPIDHFTSQSTNANSLGRRWPLLLTCGLRAIKKEGIWL